MKPILLIDFGSTYTKVVAVDVDSATLLGTGAAYTTVQTDINEGLENAKAALFQKTGALEFSEYYACSSAAGGLKMVTLGLVPDLTAKAAKLASLGAGAKISRVFAYQITEEDLEEIDRIGPDIVLLTGGIDGGNTDCVLHNAAMLAKSKGDFPIVMAGNRGAKSGVEKALAGKKVIATENVMPRFNELNIAPAGEKIRQVFLERIIKAKGLSKAAELVGNIIMPTPSALLEALTLLANGYGGTAGMESIMAVDIGGATTDIYSIADGFPAADHIIMKGLMEPKTKRSVEGDIGMRYSAMGIVEAEGLEKLAMVANLSLAETHNLLQKVTKETDSVPVTEAEEKLDFALAALATQIGMNRHAGELEEVYTPVGKAFAQTGKDLTGVKSILFTGGSVIHSKRAGQIAKFAMASPKEPLRLKPKQAEVLVDRKYILAGMGLLGQKYPACALEIMKKELEREIV